MQIIKKYKAEDGKEFSTDTECYIYEKKLDAIKAIEKTLPVRPSSFSGSDGFLLHDKDLLITAMKDTILLCNIPEELKTEALKDPFRFRRSVGRCLKDGNDPCRRLWYRFMCIDDYYREWGATIFCALNPEKGNQKKLN